VGRLRAWAGRPGSSGIQPPALGNGSRYAGILLLTALHSPVAGALTENNPERKKAAHYLILRLESIDYLCYP
jgi:hypothetical protein